MRGIRIGLLLTVFVTLLPADLLVSRGTEGVDRYTDDGTFISNIIAPGSGGLQDARGVAVAPNGQILVGDFGLDQILRYDATGAFIDVFSADAAIDNPFSLVFGTGGDLFVASAGNDSNVARLNAATGAVVDANFATGSPQPIGGPQYMDFGANNVLYLTDIAGRLFRFNATTGAWIGTGLYDNPEGVASNADFVFLAQRISDNVLRIPVLGGASSIVIPNGAFGGSPADMKIGPNGLLYLSADQIYRFDISGPGEALLVDSFGTGGQFMTFFTPVPEPATYALTCLGLLAGFVLRKRS